MPKFIKVEKTEFDEFIKKYPNALTKHMITYFEPPLLTYNDFSISNYPNSIVATVKTIDDNHELNEYRILNKLL